MDGSAKRDDEGNAVRPGRVIVDSAEPLIGALVAEALRGRGVEVGRRHRQEPPPTGPSVGVAIPPSSAAEFHADGWSIRLRSFPIDLPLVVIGRPSLPIATVLATRASSSGMALLDSQSLDEIDSLLSVIGLVGDGMRIIDPGFADPTQSSSSVVTDIERSVLDLVVNGYSNRAIANELFLSERTIETHVRNLMRRFGVSGSPDLNRRVLLARIVLDGAAARARGAVA